MLVNALIFHISCMAVAVALYGMLGVNNSFQPHLGIGPFVVLLLGIFGIAYICYKSKEHYSVTAKKSGALSLLWFCTLFGLALIIFSFTNSPWYLYLGGAVICGIVYFFLLKYLHFIGDTEHA